MWVDCTTLLSPMAWNPCMYALEAPWNAWHVWQRPRHFPPLSPRPYIHHVHHHGTASSERHIVHLFQEPFKLDNSPIPGRGSIIASHHTTTYLCSSSNAASAFEFSFSHCWYASQVLPSCHTTPQLVQNSNLHQPRKQHAAPQVGVGVECQGVSARFLNGLWMGILAALQI